MPFHFMLSCEIKNLFMKLMTVRASGTDCAIFTVLAKSSTLDPLIIVLIMFIFLSTYSFHVARKTIINSDSFLYTINLICQKYFAYYEKYIINSCPV